MVDLIKWQPFGSLMKDFFNDLSPLFESNSLRQDLDFVPALDIRDTAKEFEVIIDLPGMEKKDLEISVHEGVLVVKGRKGGEKREEKDGFVYFERRMGSFERRVRLPENVKDDSIKADYKDGVLKLTAPKEEIKKPEARKIEIK